MFATLDSLRSKSHNWFLDNRWLLIRALVLAGTLSFVTALPRLLSLAEGHRSRMLLLAIIPLLGFTVVTLRLPQLGLFLLLVGSLTVPFAISTGSLTSINISILLVGALTGIWILDILVNQSRQFSLARSRTLLPLFLFLISSIISFLVGQFPWFVFAQQAAPLTAQLGGLAIFVLSAAAFLLAAHQLQDLRWLQLLTWSFLALGALFIAGWLLPFVAPISNRLFPPGVYDNSMFWTWLVALATGQALFNKDLHTGERLALGGFVATTLYVGMVLNSGWKAGYLPPLVSIGVLLILRFRRLGWLLALTGVVLGQYLVSDAITTDQYSYSTRLDAWLIMFEIIKVSPILGLGPANYYWYTPLFRIRGYQVTFNSHNQYVDIAAQSGLLGLAFFLWFAFEVGRVGWQLRERAPVGFARAYVYGALGGLAGTLAAGMLVDWILPFVYNIGFRGFRGSVLAWLFLGGLIAIEQLSHGEQKQATEGEEPAPIMVEMVT